MSKCLNLVGQRFGRLIVVKRVENYIKPSGKKEARWLTECDCGNKIKVTASNLTSGHTKSCGCYNKEKISKRSLIDLSGMRFGSLTVIKRTDNHLFPSGSKGAQWIADCDCGNRVIVLGSSLRIGHTISCGCLNESFIASKLKKYCIEKYNAETEYRIVKNPKTNYYLPYDIYILYKKINNIYIEVNGSQHYILGSWHIFQAKRSNTTPKKVFEYLQYKDQIKREFAKQKGTYIEIDLRKTKSIDETIKYIESIIQ